METLSNEASPLPLVTTGLAATDNVPPPALLAIASVTLSPAMALPKPSCTCATSGIAVPAAISLFVAGCVVKLMVAGAAATILKALPVAACEPVASVARNVYPLPIMSSDAFANVALPLLSVATGFAATDKLALPGLLAIASVTLSPATALPWLSCTCATNAIAVPATTLLLVAGCVVQATLAGGPTVMSKAVLVAAATPALLSVAFS